jgi:peptide deformylase
MSVVMDALVCGEIVKYPDPFLLQPCRDVTLNELALTGKLVNGVPIVELADRMKDMMFESNGIGLAAPQVRVNARMFVLATSDHETITVINPVLSDLRGTMNEKEGCLSVPGVMGMVKRSQALTLTGVDEKGQAVKYELEGLIAGAAQHEFDHLQGQLFINKIGMAGRTMIRRGLEQLEREFAQSLRKYPPEVRERLLKAAGLR